MSGRITQQNTTIVISGPLRTVKEGFKKRKRITYCSLIVEYFLVTLVTKLVLMNLIYGQDYITVYAYIITVNDAGMLME